MAAKQEPTVSVTIFVDKEKNRVVLAEAKNDFVDILFSFLTLPMGTIIRLLGKQQSSEPAIIGCMNNLYRSVEHLSKDAFWKDTCKLMLLRPRNMWATHLRNLKVNVDDSEPTMYYICSNLGCSRKDSGGLLSYYKNARCSCGELMNREIGFMDSDVSAVRGNGEVFVKGVTKFIITDELQVMTSSPGTSVKLLSIHGIRDVNQLDEQARNVGLEEILNLLKHSLNSKSPLTDAFLPKQEINSNTTMLDPPYSFLSQNKTETETTEEKMTVKVTIRKSDNKALYAEAREDFVDFIFSFLTTPLGAVVKFLGGESKLGCIDVLYKSVEDLNSEWFVPLKPKTLRVVLAAANHNLLNSRLDPKFCCHNPPVNIYGVEPQYYCYSYRSRYYLTTHVESVMSNSKKVFSPLTLMYPKTPGEENSRTAVFMRTPAIFMVWDDLVVTSLPFYSIPFLKTLETPIDDLQERVISISKKEALNLLKAALITTSALTNGLNLLIKKPKQEECCFGGAA